MNDDTLAWLITIVIAATLVGFGYLTLWIADRRNRKRRKREEIANRTFADMIDIAAKEQRYRPPTLQDSNDYLVRLYGGKTPDK